jgi:hypothetical protein
MPDHLVTIASFSTPEEAALARNFLETRGIKAFLTDEETVGMFWHLGNAVGGVKLQVADDDQDRAQLALEQRDGPSPESPEHGIAEGRTCPMCGTTFSDEYDDCPECGPPEDVLKEESETSITTPEVVAGAEADDLARRALRASVFGLLFAPIGLYALWLLLDITRYSGELSPTGLRKVIFAVGLVIVDCLLFYLLCCGLNPLRIGL